MSEEVPEAQTSSIFMLSKALCNLEVRAMQLLEEQYFKFNRPTFVDG